MEDCRRRPQSKKKIVVPHGSIGFRWGEKGKWNLEEKDGTGKDTDLAMSLIDEADHDEIAEVAFPYFGNRAHEHFAGTNHDSVLVRKVPAKKSQTGRGGGPCRLSLRPLRGQLRSGSWIGDPNSAKSYDEGLPYTPAWQKKSPVFPRITSSR